LFYPSVGTFSLGNLRGVGRFNLRSADGVGGDGCGVVVTDEKKLMSKQRFPWIYEALEWRKEGKKPRFEPPVHHCPICGKDWLCSDRYTQEFCSPQKDFPNANDLACSICLGGEVFNEEDRRAYWEAHGASQKE
jgi:hypothetical protein